MKNIKLGFAISTIVLIAGAIMKIMHVDYGSLVMLLGFIAGTVFSMLYTRLLEKRIKELEEKKG